MKIILFFFCMLGGITAGEIRVVSYNIHHGAGMDGKLDLQRIAAIIQKENPDLVALQEVDNGVARSGKIDQAAVLAKILGMHHAFGKTIDLQGGQYGNAVLSKYLILKTHVHRLPGKGEARVVLEVVVEKGGEKLSFCCAHLDHRSETTRLPQAQFIVKTLAQHKHPVILLGDFNALPNSETMRLLAKTWNIIPKTGDHLTYPAGKPRIEIDYILTRGLTTTKSTCRVLVEKTASDHRPLAAVIPE